MKFLPSFCYSCIILITISSSSCNAIMKSAYGIKDAKIENEKSIKQFAQKMGLRTDNL